MVRQGLMQFLLNGKETEYTGDPAMTLFDYIKNVAGLTVTDVGCAGAGRCGACTVEVDGKAVLSCRTPMARVADALVETSGETGQLIQDIFSMALRKRGTPECHYCVPEVMMKARLFLEKNPEPTEKDARYAIAHHLCHCIGHYKVARSLLDAAEILKTRAVAPGPVDPA